jgi:hypothetical protein
MDHPSNIELLVQYAQFVLRGDKDKASQFVAKIRQVDPQHVWIKRYGNKYLKPNSRQVFVSPFELTSFQKEIHCTSEGGEQGALEAQSGADGVLALELTPEESSPPSLLPWLTPHTNPDSAMTEVCMTVDSDAIQVIDF